MNDNAPARDAEDLRSELQKREEQEMAQFAALPRASQVLQRLRSAMDRLSHQIKHNAPASPDILSELQAIHDFIAAGKPTP